MLGQEEAAMPYEPEESDDDSPSTIVAIIRKHESRLFSIDGVVGLSPDVNEIGEEIIRIMISDSGSVASIPQELDGIPVRVEVTGEIDAY